MLGVGGYAVVNKMKHDSFLPMGWETSIAYYSGQLKHGGLNDNHTVVHDDDLICEPEKYMNKPLRTSTIVDIYADQGMIKAKECYDGEERALRLQFDDTVDWNKMKEEVKKDPTITLYGNLVDNDTFFVEDYEDARDTKKKDDVYFEKSKRNFIEGIVDFFNVMGGRFHDTREKIPEMYDEGEESVIGVINSSIKAVDNTKEVIDEFAKTEENIKDKVADTNAEINKTMDNINSALNDTNKIVDESTDLIDEGANTVGQVTVFVKNNTDKIGDGMGKIIP